MAAKGVYACEDWSSAIKLQVSNITLTQWEELISKKHPFYPYYIMFKVKSPEVPFHVITWSYSYFEVISIFASIQEEAKHDQE